jgi:hypothetical protein
MIVYGDPETWGMTVDQFLDSRRLEQEKLFSKEPLSKNKTYSEIDILSNIDAKNPSGITREDIITYPMPEFEGMEDPRNRQLELADGGIVEREEFSKGGEAKELKKLITSDREKFKKKFKPFLNKYFQNNLTQASEYLNLDRGRIQSIFRRSGEPLLTDRRRLSEAKPGGVDVADFNINIATDQNFKENLIKKLGSNSNYVDANELGGKLGIDVTDKKQKDYLLSILKKLNIKSKPNPISTRSRLYQISDSVKQLIKNPIKLIEGQAKSANLRKNYERNLDPELFNFKDSLKKITNNVTNQAGFKLNKEKVQKIEDIGHPISLQVASRYPKLFKNSNTVSLQSLIYQDPKLNRDILSKLGIDNSYSKIFEKLNSFVGKKITPEDQKTIRQLNKDMSDIRERAVKLIQEEAKREPYFVGQEKRIPLIKADIPQVGSNFKSENLKADMSVVDDFYRVGQPNQINPNVNKFKNFTETEKLQYVENLSKQNADNVAKFFANVTDKTTGRPVVPMNELNDLKFTLETEINDNLKQYIKSTKILENFNAKEQSVLTGFGNKVAMGLDPTDIIKALPEKEAQILKGVGSKIGNVAKLGARGVQELLVGTGPLGIGLTALISLPLAINELSEGARGSEAIQNTISDLTFGLTPRSDERIIKEIGGESAVKGMEIQKNIDDYRSITQEINNLENQMRDPSFLSLSPDDQDRIQSSLIQNEEALKEKENFLIPRININKKGEIESPEYEDYLKADNKRQLERELRLTGRNQESDINALTGEAAGQDQDQFDTLLDNRLLIDSLQKKYVGNQPKQTTYPSVMQGTVGEPVDNIINRNFAYAVGGRVGFKKGSKDKDSPVIPISPLTDLPQNESRRDFLKGMGAVGLGAVALGSGLLKLGKAAAPISEITKIVKGTTAPSWMDSLITKILKEGIELKSDPNSNVLIKKVKFKNPKTGVEEEATLTFDKQKNSYEIEYSSDETVGGKYGDKVFLKVEPEYAYDPQLQKMVPTGKHKFNAIEAEPEIVNPDGDIEMTGENVASKIIDLRSDISGLKSYVTGGKGIDKKIVKEKEALVKRAEEDPLADIEDNPRYSPRHYDLDEFSN